MGVRIIVNDSNNSERGSVMFDSVTMWAFGPVFKQPADAQEFIKWLEPVDPRKLTTAELEHKYGIWLKGRS